jgi:hypothetical protein
MTMRELDRFKVIRDVGDGVLKPWRAAERLGLTTRQIRRVVMSSSDYANTGRKVSYRVGVRSPATTDWTP